MISAEAQNAFLTAALAAGAARGIEPAPAASWIEIIGDTRCDTCCAVLALAGVEQYTSSTAYRVPVRRDHNGLLIVAGEVIDPPILVPAPDSPPAAFRVIRDSQGAPAAIAEYPVDPQERAYRVEVRIDETWLTTLIVHARDEILASDEALKLAMAREPHADIDVWSVSLDEEVTEESPAAVMGAAAGEHEPGSVESAGPGGAADFADPGFSRRSTPAFASPPPLPEPLIPGDSPRGENFRESFDEKLAQGYDTASLLTAAQSDRLPSIRPAALKELARRGIFIGAPSSSYEPPLILKLRLSVDKFAFVQFAAFEDHRLPSPNERADWIVAPLSRIEVREMITRLHHAEDLSVYALTP